MLNLKPWEFWSLTIAEFQAMLDGYEVRDDRAWRQAAQLAAWSLAPWSKKRLSADDLLKRRPARRTVRRPRGDSPKRGAPDGRRS